MFQRNDQRHVSEPVLLFVNRSWHLGANWLNQCQNYTKNYINNSDDYKILKSFFSDNFCLASKTFKKLLVSVYKTAEI